MRNVQRTFTASSSRWAIASPRTILLLLWSIVRGQEVLVFFADGEVAKAPAIWPRQAGRKHGGEPSPVESCYRIGMSYVSCSPYRVPLARLAAAQAAISSEKTEAARTA